MNLFLFLFIFRIDTRCDLWHHNCTHLYRCQSHHSLGHLEYEDLFCQELAQWYLGSKFCRTLKFQIFRNQAKI